MFKNHGQSIVIETMVSVFSCTMLPAGGTPFLPSLLMQRPRRDHVLKKGLQRCPSPTRCIANDLRLDFCPFWAPKIYQGAVGVTSGQSQRSGLPNTRITTQLAMRMSPKVQHHHSDSIVRPNAKRKVMVISSQRHT